MACTVALFARVETGAGFGWGFLLRHRGHDRGDELDRLENLVEIVFDRGMKSHPSRFDEIFAR